MKLIRYDSERNQILFHKIFKYWYIPISFMILFLIMYLLYPVIFSNPRIIYPRNDGSGKNWLNLYALIFWAAFWTVIVEIWIYGVLGLNKLYIELKYQIHKIPIKIVLPSLRVDKDD